jgi:Domain of unknown function (DUF4062)
MNEVATRLNGTLGRRWKVFVSSTSSGLGDLRRIAGDVTSGFTYAGVKCFEPVMMEDFGAQDGPAREVCADKIRDCDVLIGIIGIRYGAHPPDDQTSYTELEFQAAVEHGLSRLVFLLDEKLARDLEGAAPQGEDRADRQERFRERVGTDRVAEMTVGTEQDFREKLTSALETWVRESSFKRTLIDHSAEFKSARSRLLSLGERAGGATLIFGEPGTGKSVLFDALLNDVPLRHHYCRLAGPQTVWLGEGKEAAEQVRAQVSAALDDFAAEMNASRAALPPVLIALHLESDVDTGKDVDPDTLGMLPRLFSWNLPRAVVLAETNNHAVLEHLERDLGWTRGTVINVRDYASVSDALTQMKRNAPDVRRWPEPDTRILAEALGLRPISLFAAAKDITAQAGHSQRLVPKTIRQQLDAIAHEKSPAGKYAALLRNSIDRLSPQARELLARITVLHPKPTLFPDEIAVALDLSLDPDDAIRIATSVNNDEELVADDQCHLERAYELVAELVERGLLERVPGLGDGQEDSPEFVTLHPANVRVIHDYLPLTENDRVEGHARAEAFYRARVGEAVSGSFDSRFRMEKGTWWDDAEEWIYHFSHIAPDQAGVRYASLFLDAFWWWDTYIRFSFCDKLLDYANGPRVQVIGPDVAAVTRLLTELRDTYPREYEITRARTLAEIAGDDPPRTASRGAGIIPILHRLCGRLGITELNTLFPGASPQGSPLASSPAPDQTRLHLLGLICLFLAEGYRFAVSSGEPGATALAAAEACYRQAESYFLLEENSWDGAWTHYLLGEVISLLGGDPELAWDEADSGADEECDTELLAQIERARADHLRSLGDLDGALAHYGRAVFYGAALQVTSNLQAGADAYTLAVYREMRLHATKVLAEPLLRDQGSSPDKRLAEAGRRLKIMLGEWGGHWNPEAAALDRVFRSASLEAVERSADAIADAAFPPAPGDAVLGKLDSRYYREVDDLIEHTRAQSWVKGLDRWAEYRESRC